MCGSMKFFLGTVVRLQERYGVGPSHEIPNERNPYGPFQGGRLELLGALLLDRRRLLHRLLAREDRRVRFGELGVHVGHRQSQRLFAAGQLEVSFWLGWLGWWFRRIQVQC